MNWCFSFYTSFYKPKNIRKQGRNRQEEHTGKSLYVTEYIVFFMDLRDTLCGHSGKTHVSMHTLMSIVMSRTDQRGWDPRKGSGPTKPEQRSRKHFRFGGGRDGLLNPWCNRNKIKESSEFSSMIFAFILSFIHFNQDIFSLWNYFLPIHKQRLKSPPKIVNLYLLFRMTMNLNISKE